jgi:hypothetical protein
MENEMIHTICRGSSGQKSWEHENCKVPYPDDEYAESTVAVLFT